MLDSLEHFPLIVGVFDLLHLDDLLLFQDLDGIETLVMLGLDQVNSTEGTCAQSSLHGEVCEGVFALCLPCSALAVDRAGRRADEAGNIHVPVGLGSFGIWIGSRGDGGGCLRGGGGGI